MKVGLLLGLMVLIATSTIGSYGEVPNGIMRRIRSINKKGPYLGLVVPNSFEMNPLLHSPNFLQDLTLPYLDFGGRRFRFGRIGKERVILVMTGLSMLNAGLGTQLLLTLFEVKGVVHFGVAGNADSNLQIGDVTIPRFWAHTGLLNWQRDGNGPNDELAFESSGDFTRKIGYLNFSDYTVSSSNDKSTGNFLNSFWYQPEEIYPVNGVPEFRQHSFWVPVNRNYYALSKKLKSMELERCVNSTTCLARSPMVVRVEKGCSANVFVDNADYRKFLASKFLVTPIDMESAAVALVCRQQQTPFIAIRALSDLAGGGSSQSNEASIFASLAAQNAVSVVIQFIYLLS